MTRPRVGYQPRVNPFATRFVAPGAIPYRFADPSGLKDLVRLLEANDGWGEIIGPHGSGKSTLVAALIPQLTMWNVRRIRLNTSERKLPSNIWDRPLPRTLLVIDGFEQLGYFRRRQVKKFCRKRQAGLLITAHQSMGLPRLHQTDVPSELAGKIIGGLVPAGAEWVLEGFDALARLRFHNGSLREVLFELYDRWEEDRSHTDTIDDSAV